MALEFLLGVMNMFKKLLMEMVTQFYKCPQNYLPVHTSNGRTVQ